MRIIAHRLAGGICAVLVCGLLSTSVNARADEPETRARFIRIAAGAAFVHDSTVDARTHFPDASEVRVIEAGTVGHVNVTGGVWLQPGSRFGGAIDVSYQRHVGGGATFDHFGTSLLVLARRSFTADVHGYLALGPTAVFTLADIDFQPDLPRAFDGGGYGFGVDARAGLTRRVSRRTFADCEYRFVHHDVDIETQTAEYLLGLPSRLKENVQATVDSHTVAVGLGLRF